MNQEDVKVSFYLKKNESDSAGRCPVMGRLTIGHSECVFSAKMLAPSSLWTSGRMKGKSTEAVEINRRLDELRDSALAIYREQSAIRERVTAEEVKCLLLGMAFGQETLLAYFRSFIEHFEKRVGVNRTAKSARTYRCACEHVGRFLSERLRLSDIPFSALDRSFIDKFDLYLRTERRLTAVDCTKGDLKRRIGAVVKPAAAMYRFQTLGEFRALLSFYNIGIEEVRGERVGKPYRGLLYTVLDENGDKAAAAPLKSSLFGKSVGFEELERHMERSRERIKRDDTRKRLCRRVDEALRTAATERALRDSLRKERVDLYLRRNDTGRIVGVTFIDHSTRTVVNGSRLGKAYSANAFEERFGNRDETTRPMQPAEMPLEDANCKLE